MRLPLGISFMIMGLVAFSASLEATVIYTNDDVPGSNTVWQFSVAADGSLKVVSSVATGGSGMGGGAYAVNRIIASGSRLFVSNGGNGSVSAFAIDSTTGNLTAAGSPYATGAGFGDISLAATPDGKFLFAGLSAKNSVIVMNIGADGSLSSAAFSVAMMTAPAGMKVTPGGHFLAVALPAFGTAVEMLSIAANGALTSVGSFYGAGSGNLAALDIDCAGSHLFGSEITAAKPVVHVFSISSTGSLTEMQGSPYTPATGVNSGSLLLSPNDQFLFVSNEGSTSITAFSVASAGTLSPVPGSPFTLGTTFPGSMAMDQNGTLLYVASYSGAGNLIYGFNIGAGGSLAPISGSPFGASATASGLLSLAAFPSKACGVVPPPPPSGDGENVQIQINYAQPGDNSGNNGNNSAGATHPNAGTKKNAGATKSDNNNNNNGNEGNQDAKNDDGNQAGRQYSIPGRLQRGCAVHQDLQRALTSGYVVPDLRTLRY